jgi:hypothetical protein
MWEKLLQGHILSTTGDALRVSNLSHLVFWTGKLLNKQAGSFDQFFWNPLKIPFFLSQGNSSVQCEFSVSENDWIILLDDDDDDDDLRLWVLDNKDTKIAAFFSVYKSRHKIHHPLPFARQGTSWEKHYIKYHIGICS